MSHVDTLAVTVLRTYYRTTEHVSAFVHHRVQNVRSEAAKAYIGVATLRTPNQLSLHLETCVEIHVILRYISIPRKSEWPSQSRAFIGVVS
jgi:hypothetical protein